MTITEKITNYLNEGKNFKKGDDVEINIAGEWSPATIVDGPFIFPKEDPLFPNKTYYTWSIGKIKGKNILSGIRYPKIK